MFMWVPQTLAGAVGPRRPCRLILVSTSRGPRVPLSSHLASAKLQLKAIHQGPQP